MTTISYNYKTNAEFTYESAEIANAIIDYYNNPELPISKKSINGIVFKVANSKNQLKEMFGENKPRTVFLRASGAVAADDVLGTENDIKIEKKA